MSVQEIEQAITQLTNEEYDQLRAWLARHDGSPSHGSLVELAGTIDHVDLAVMAREIEDAGGSVATSYPPFRWERS